MFSDNEHGLSAAPERGATFTTRVSVVVATHDDARSIEACVRSILATDYPDLCVIVVDDCSTDDTRAVLASIDDERLTVVRSERRLGPAGARNLGLARASAELVFFTDADCTVGPRWLHEGVAAFAEGDVVGVEGRVLYRCERPTVRHRLPINPFYAKRDAQMGAPGRDFATCNIAYRADVIRALGGFDEARYPNGREDTDLAFRALKRGRIVHRAEMIATHAEELWTFRELLESARRYRADVTFFKDHGDFFFRRGRVIHPDFLWLALFPPAIFRRYGGDLRFVPQLYAYLLLLRLHIWKAAIDERTFVV